MKSRIVVADLHQKLMLDGTYSEEHTKVIHTKAKVERVFVERFNEYTEDKFYKIDEKATEELQIALEISNEEVKEMNDSIDSVNQAMAGAVKKSKKQQ